MKKLLRKLARTFRPARTLDDLSVEELKEHLLTVARLYEAFYGSWPEKDRPIAGNGIIRVVRILRKKGAFA